MHKEKLLIVGCGDLGKRLGQRLKSSEYTIHGLCRRRCSLPMPIQPRTGDVSDRTMTAALLQREAYDVVVITLTPDERSDEGYRRAYVDTMAVLVDELSKQARLPRLVIFVSSTGVYGQDTGEWVDERSETKPSTFSGKRLLEAEQLLLNTKWLDPESSRCILRFSGIYGRSQTAKVARQYDNRIHVDDGIGVLEHLIQLSRQGVVLAPIYVASDCSPCERLSQGKRCSNQLLLSTGYQFLYPDYYSGS